MGGAITEELSSVGHPVRADEDHDRRPHCPSGLANGRWHRSVRKPTAQGGGRTDAPSGPTRPRTWKRTIVRRSIKRSATRPKKMIGHSTGRERETSRGIGWRRRRSKQADGTPTETLFFHWVFHIGHPKGRKPFFTLKKENLSSREARSKSGFWEKKKKRRRPKGPARTGIRC